MTRIQLEQLEEALTKLVDSRRQLGGFDANANDIMILAQALLLLTRHLQERPPKHAKVKQRKR